MKLPTSFKPFYKTHYSLEKDFDTGGLYIAGNIEDSDFLQKEKLGYCAIVYVQTLEKFVSLVYDPQPKYKANLFHYLVPFDVLS